jgi:hypothetical protein
LLEFTYKASLLLPNLEALIIVVSSRIYNFLLVVANNRILLNLLNAIVFILLIVLTLVAIIVKLALAK